MNRVGLLDAIEREIAERSESQARRDATDFERDCASLFQRHGIKESARSHVMLSAFKSEYVKLRSEQISDKLKRDALIRLLGSE